MEYIAAKRDDCIATVQSRQANDLRSMGKEPGGGGGDNCYAIPWTPDSPCLETCASFSPPRGPENEARMQQQGGASGMRPSDCLTGYDSIPGEKEIRCGQTISEAVRGQQTAAEARYLNFHAEYRRTTFTVPKRAPRGNGAPIAVRYRDHNGNTYSGGGNGGFPITGVRADPQGRQQQTTW